jgi:hypothetical protein
MILAFPKALPLKVSRVLRSYDVQEIAYHEARHEEADGFHCLVAHRHRFWSFRGGLTDGASVNPYWRALIVKFLAEHRERQFPSHEAVASRARWGRIVAAKTIGLSPRRTRK